MPARSSGMAGKHLRDPDASSRRFWALAIGVMVEGHAMGRSAEEMCAEMLRVLGDQATTTTGERQYAGCVWSATATHPIQIARRGEIIMTALRMRARDFLNEDQLIAVRQRVTWKGDQP